MWHMREHPSWEGGYHKAQDGHLVPSCCHSCEVLSHTGLRAIQAPGDEMST